MISKILWLNVKWMNCYDECSKIDIYNVSSLKQRVDIASFALDALDRIDQIIQVSYVQMRIVTNRLSFEEKAHTI